MRDPNSQPAFPLLGFAASALCITAVLVVSRFVLGYLFFHTATELITVVVAAGAFVVAWNTRTIAPNRYTLILGIAFLAVAVLDAFHAMLYRGMTVLPIVESSNLPTQVWLAGRYLHVSGLLLAPVAIGRNVRVRTVVVGYALATLMLVGAIVWGWFPTAYVEGEGLTAFKIVSEWAIMAGFAVAMLLHRRIRSAFDPETLRLLLLSMGLTIVAEGAFTLYADPYGPANLVGHAARLLAYAFLYRAVIESALTRPYEVLFRDVMQASEALARNDEILRHQRDLSRALNDLDHRINATADTDDILRMITEGVGIALNADSTAAVMHEGSQWIGRYTWRFPTDIIGMGFSDDAVRHALLAAETGEPVAIDDTSMSDLVDPELMRMYSITAVLAIPLGTRGDDLGTLYVMQHGGTRHYTPAEKDFGTQVAVSVSLALNSARLLEEQRVVSDTLQTALLSVPESLPGVRYAHAYQSATELARIGGDFYDIFETAPGVIAFVLGDISGKGLEAAAFTAMVRSTLRAFAYESEGPAEVLTHANRAVLSQIPEGRFITAVVVYLETRTGRLRIASAGHPAPVFCARGDAEEVHVPSNLPLGVLPDVVFEETEMQLGREEGVVLFSDGLLEARHDMDFFGVDGIEGVLLALGTSDPDSLVETLMARAAEWAGGRVTDDMAIVAFTLA